MQSLITSKNLCQKPVERVSHPRRLERPLEEQLGEGRDGPGLVFQGLEQLRQIVDELVRTDLGHPVDGALPHLDVREDGQELARDSIHLGIVTNTP